VNSNDTRVWLDLGPPGAGASAACALVPPPRAVTASGGGLLAYATCIDDERELVLFDQIDRGVDPANSAGLYFADPHRPQDSDSILDPHFPVNLFGDSKNGRAGTLERGTGQPTFTVFDCRPGTGYTPISGLNVDPTNNRTLDPRVGNPTGSAWDATEYAYEAVASDCDPSTDNPLGSFVYGGVISHARSPDEPAGAVRTSTDDVFTFSAGSRGAREDLSAGLPTDNSVGDATSIANSTADSTLGARAPRDAGLPFLRGQVQGPLWSSKLVWQHAQTTQPVFTTAYARLNRSDISRYGWTLPAFLPGVFGSEACGGSTGSPGARDINGWACDPTKWYRADDGSDTMPYTSGGAQYGKPLAVRVGETYDMTDVDCFDGHLATVAGVDVKASADDITNAQPC
jgi:hypothetical protein